jgi:hypothetical protein
MVVDTAHQLYYADVIDLALKDPDWLETLSKKAMDMICKEHMTIFHKQLLVCDPSLGLEFLQDVQIHYDMNQSQKCLLKNYKC